MRRLFVYHLEHSCQRHLVTANVGAAPNRYLKGENGNEKARVREKDEAKTKVSDLGSKFNIQHCVYIGRAHRPILCFSWIELQSKLSRWSTPQSSCRKLQMWQARHLLQPGYKTFRGLFSLLKAGGRSLTSYF